MLKRKKWKGLLTSISLGIGLSVFAPTALTASAEDIDWNKKLTAGKDIAYWISPSCEYTVSIPNAAYKLTHPTGMTNPLVLSKTTVKSSSKMDFYQYSHESEGIAGKASVFRKNSSGNYYEMAKTEKDVYDWIYGEVKINDPVVQNFKKTGSIEKSEKIEAAILHEMLHVYGLKDLTELSNKNSIMYGFSNMTATKLTSDANAVLNAKY